MTFTHQPLDDASAQIERRERLSAPDYQLRMWGPWRVASVTCATGLAAGLVAFFAMFVGNPMPIPGITAAVVMLASHLVFFSSILHDASAKEKLDSANVEFEVAPDHELQYALSMKEQYQEIDTAVREWVRKGLTIRNRDVWAIRAWVEKMEPGRSRERLMTQLAS